MAHTSIVMNVIDDASISTAGFPVSPLPAGPQTAFPGLASWATAASDLDPSAAGHHRQNPRKKRRTQLIRIDNSSTGGVASVGIVKPKHGKRPDPSAPKITRPCSECGKKFWSWKALFGHMRCHPERQWRGINPPQNFRRPPNSALSSKHAEGVRGLSSNPVTMTEEDHDLAACLLMLANAPGPGARNAPPANSQVLLAEPKITITTRDIVALGGDGGHGDSLGDSEGAIASSSLGVVGTNCRFECLSCRKVFGSHQALGGYRASHKNVEACLAITMNNSDDIDDGTIHCNEDGMVLELRRGEDHQSHSHGHNRTVVAVEEASCEDEEEKITSVDSMRHGEGQGHHKCNICLRLFRSGQALGGHKRCHWEKVGELQSLVSSSAAAAVAQQQRLISPYSPFAAATSSIRQACGGLDLNSPAPIESSYHDHHYFPSSPHYSSPHSSGLALDLRLGL